MEIVLTLRASDIKQNHVPYHRVRNFLHIVYKVGVGGGVTEEIPDPAISSNVGGSWTGPST